MYTVPLALRSFQVNSSKPNNLLWYNAKIIPNHHEDHDTKNQVSRIILTYCFKLKNDTFL